MTFQSEIHFIRVILRHAYRTTHSLRASHTRVYAPHVNLNEGEQGQGPPAASPPPPTLPPALRLGPALSTLPPLRETMRATSSEKPPPLGTYTFAWLMKAKSESGSEERTATSTFSLCCRYLATLATYAQLLHGLWVCGGAALCRRRHPADPFPVCTCPFASTFQPRMPPTTSVRVEKFPLRISSASGKLS